MRLLSFPIALTLVALLVACSGDNPDVTRTPLSSQDAHSQLLESIKQSQTVVAKVSYTVEGTPIDGDRAEKWILVQRPPDFREDDLTNSPFHEVSIIIVNRRYYLCRALRDGEGEPPEGECLVSPEGEVREGPTPVGHQLIHSLADLLRESPTGFEINGTSERSVAGRKASCFVLQSRTIEDFDTGELCYSEDSILLFSDGRRPGERYVATATEVSSEVSDKDFELPPLPVENFQRPSPPATVSP